MTTTTTRTTKTTAHQCPTPKAAADDATAPKTQGAENPHGLRFDETEDSERHFDRVVSRLLRAIAPRGTTIPALVDELKINYWNRRHVYRSLKRLEASGTVVAFDVDGATYYCAPKEGQEPYVDLPYSMSDDVATLYSAICGVFAPRTIRRQPLVACMNGADDR